MTAPQDARPDGARPHSRPGADPEDRPDARDRIIDGPEDAPDPKAAEALSEDAFPDAKPRGARARLFGSRIVRMFWNALKDAGLVAGRAYKHFDADEGWILSGYIAYAVLLAMFPFMIFTASLAAALVGPEELQAAIDWLFTQAPARVAETIAPVLEDVLGRDRGGLLTISAAGALWAASNGVEAFRAAFDRAYESRRVRNFVLRRVVGMGYVLLGSLTFAILGFAIVLAPIIFHAVEVFTGFTAPIGVGILRYAVGIGAFIAFLWAIHRFLPSRSQRGARLLPGIVSTLVLWMAGATAFSIYLGYAPSYSVTYGSIAGVIVTLLFFYLTGAAIIFGAEVNAALERLTGEAETRAAEEAQRYDAAEARRAARAARRRAAKAVKQADEADEVAEQAGKAEDAAKTAEEAASRIEERAEARAAG